MGEIEDAIVMDKKTFKSLTSETRTAILKLLKKRNHTLSEISSVIKISKTTAKEHLDVLLEGRLIEQVPSTHKWKYYTLTKDGRKLVGSEGPKRVVIILGTAILGMILALYGFLGSMQPVQTMAGASAMEENAVRGAADAFAEKDMALAAPPAEAVETAAETVAETAPDYLSIIIGIVGLCMILMALIMFLNRRKKGSVL